MNIVLIIPTGIGCEIGGYVNNCNFDQKWTRHGFIDSAEDWKLSERKRPSRSSAITSVSSNIKCRI